MPARRGVHGLFQRREYTICYLNTYLTEDSVTRPVRGVSVANNVNDFYDEAFYVRWNMYTIKLSELDAHLALPT